MPDNDLSALLRERAAAAPDPRPLTDAFVRRVRRRRAARLALSGGGAVAGVGLAVLAVVSYDTPPRAIVPAAPLSPSPTADYDDRYEFCTVPATDALVVTPYGSELKYNRGCYVATAGVPVTLTFTNLSDVPHNVVVKPDGGEPFAKTDDLVASGRTNHTVDLGRLARGDYVIYCGLHPGMQAQLIAR